MKTSLIIFIFFIFSQANTLLAQGNASLTIVFEGLRNEEGYIRISLFDSEEGFPEDADKAYTSKSIDLSKQAPRVQFNDLKAGAYAYAILHDEDGNGKMNKNLLGMPREGFGFSRNYRPRMKNPSFEDASVNLRNGENKHNIEIIYFL